MLITEEYLNVLNDLQLKAVQTIEGPVLVLAGAGTGKTRVLTTRIAYIIDKQYALPWQILAVTFTNKAAKEIIERVSNFTNSSGIWLGTYHSICVKILRKYASLIGFNEQFTIIDYDDQLRLIKNIMKEKLYDEKSFPPKVILTIISRWKDFSLSPNMLSSVDIATSIQQVAKRIYEEYQSRLIINSAMDFGDLLLNVLKLFTEHPNVLEEYQKQFKYILVDEYQDTNVAQYLLLRMLVSPSNNNICCVGDEDQTIYSWRGATITNILKFEKDFPGAQIIRLEQNYRSTNNILRAASCLIDHNEERFGKNLWTKDGDGEKIKLVFAMYEQEESRFVARKILQLKGDGYNYNDVAILVRAGFQTRSFEECFINHSINYRVVGGFKFYERMEIRDVISYIRVSVLLNDNFALERIINTPKRNIGNTTLINIQEYARENEFSLFSAIKKMTENKLLPARQAVILENLMLNFERWHNLFKDNKIHHAQVVEVILDESGYLEMWRNDRSSEAQARIENIRELIQALQEFSNIKEFLEYISLVTDNDTADSKNTVNIMTIHAAKGMEFKIVFLAGWEEGLFPYPKAIEEKGKQGLEEERRLAYVGITRARNQVYILCSANRRIYGQYQNNLPSRFINELPQENIEILDIGNGLFFKRTDHIKKDKLKPGDQILHKKFGSGVITKIENDQLEIIFENYGIKRIIETYVQKI